MILPKPVGDVAVLVARVLLGVVLVAHGIQKLVTNGLGGTATAFAEMGVPLPAISAYFATVAEIGGGLLVLIGLATSLAAVLVVLDMVGALLIVHVGNGVFVAQNGWELVGLIAAVALLIAASGAGRFSVDGVLVARRRSGVAA